MDVNVGEARIISVDLVPVPVIEVTIDKTGPAGPAGSGSSAVLVPSADWPPLNPVPGVLYVEGE